MGAYSGGGGLRGGGLNEGAHKFIVEIKKTLLKVFDYFSRNFFININ